jgi:hypothetical protein
MTGDDVTLAAGFFNQPSSVVLLIETVEGDILFFWDGGKMLEDFSLMDFPLDAHQLDKSVASTSATKSPHDTQNLSVSLTKRQYRRPPLNSSKWSGRESETCPR